MDLSQITVIILISDILIPIFPMESQSKESRFQMALNAYKKGQLKTKKAAGLAFDIPQSTFRRRIEGTILRFKKKKGIAKKYQKLGILHYQHGLLI